MRTSLLFTAFLAAMFCTHISVAQKSDELKVEEKKKISSDEIKKNSSFSIGLESGVVKPTTMTMQSPGSGSELKLDDGIESKYMPYGRGELEYRYHRKHFFTAVGHLAPLLSEGKKGEPYTFGDRAFSDVEDSKFRLKMVFFRFSYKIDVFAYKREGWSLAIGPAIQHNRFRASAEDPSGEEVRDISSTIPLLELGADWEFMPQNHIYFTADANAFMSTTHQEAFVGYGYKMEKLLFKAGYRFIRSEMDEGDTKITAVANHAALSLSYFFLRESEIIRKSEIKYID